MTGSTSREHTLQLALGGKQVDLYSVIANEGISKHFSVLMEVFSPLEDIDLHASLGTAACIAVRRGDDLVRYFHGIISEAESLDVDFSGYRYRIRLSPTALFHDQGRNFRIFQNKTVIEIVKNVLDQCQITYKVKAEGGTRNRPYCVQYGESDFAFVSRLLEEHGLYYFYDHKTDKHEMVICDKNAQSIDSPIKDLIYNDSASSMDQGDQLLETTEGFLHRFVETATTTGIGKVTFRDFDFKDPKLARESIVEKPSKHTLDSMEVFDWPGRFYTKGEGDSLANHRIESIRAQRVTHRGHASSAGICPGAKVKVRRSGHVDTTYLVISAVTQIQDNTYRSGMGGGETRVDFVTIPIATQYRAPMLTPKPKAAGPETAIVTGPSDEEIHVDEFGRIKVHFHWDRLGKMDDTSSCWVRVSQTGGLGNIIHPRVGQEVLVDFIGGDPDRPIVVGRVYNQEHKPTYELPANKTRAVWRTKTYKKTSGDSHQNAKSLDTGAPGANELRFEDATGKEELFIHAEKDMNVRIRNDESHKVGKDVVVYVGRNRQKDIENDEKFKIGNDRVGKITNDETLKIGNKQTIEVGNEISIKANNKITLTVGASKIEITPDGITLNTINLKTQAVKADLTTSGMTEIKGGGMATVKAGMVMIN